MTPHEYAQEKAAPRGSTAYYAFLFAPEERRRAITALYAFGREIHDVVQESSDTNVARAKLAWWRAEVANVYRGNAQHPVARALADVVSAFAIDLTALQSLIDDIETELEFNAYSDFASLELYCRRVDGVLGRLSAAIFGHDDPQTLDAAEDMGVAFRLTQIIRDVGQDARRNRIYLPLHELAEYGVTSDDIVHARETDAFRKLMTLQVERAQRWHVDALAKLPARDRKAQRPIIIMAAIYRALLDEIRNDGYRVLTRRIALTPLRKLWIAWKTAPI